MVISNWCSSVDFSSRPRNTINSTFFHNKNSQLHPPFTADQLRNYEFCYEKSSLYSVALLAADLMFWDHQRQNIIGQLLLFFLLAYGHSLTMESWNPWCLVFTTFFSRFLIWFTRPKVHPTSTVKFFIFTMTGSACKIIRAAQVWLLFYLFGSWFKLGQILTLQSLDKKTSNFVICVLWCLTWTLYNLAH